MLLEGEVTRTDTLLDPKLANGKVANLADASPAADADRGAAVGKERQGDVHAQVRRDRH